MLEGGGEEGEEEPLPESTGAPRAKSPTPPIALPSFPQPRRPEAPSKSILALQGLDKALIEAQVVNPSTTLQLEASLEAQDEGTGLSGKIRRRLQDLGINELFAGPSRMPFFHHCSLPKSKLNSPDRSRTLAAVEIIV